MADKAVLPFTSRLGAEPSDDPGEQLASGNAYATVSGQRAAIGLEFIRKNGSSFTVPYSYLPLLWWEPPGTLVIEYPGVFSVLLHGKELDDLHRQIKNHRVTWVQECDPRAAGLMAVVTRIEILRSYPSREERNGGSGE